jgi:signal transduction histidine kinase
MEILDAAIKREEREIVLFIPDDCYVMADYIRLRQVLLNLLSNALKYSPAGTKIELSAESDDTQVMVRVRDCGLGVPLEEQSYLFERFIRLERDINSAVRGAGLGLYICRQLVQAMQGRIWVESSGQPGEGSTFAFTLKRSLQAPRTFPQYLDALRR